MQSAVSDIIAHNLDIVQKHMEGEAQDPASVMALYTDDIVLEAPLRGLRLTDKAAIEANYLAMFGAMSDIEIVPLDRFATETRVVDDCIVRFSLSRVKASTARPCQWGPVSSCAWCMCFRCGMA
jgi:hypothetical protein